MNRNMDLIVIGAGPAGMSCALAARRCGLDVAVVDEQPVPGGQLFRNITSRLAQTFHDDRELKTGCDLVRDFEQCGAVHIPGAVVWGMDTHNVFYSQDGESRKLTGSFIAVACGGMERPVPFPGWTLPGVLSAGGADILLKSGGTFGQDGEPVVLAGNGPLLLSLACHLLEKKVPIAGWLDTGNWTQRLLSAALMPAAVLDMPYLARGIGMFWRIVRSGVRIVSGVRNIQALGSERVEKVRWSSGGTDHELTAGTLIRHEGIIPRTHIANSLGAKLCWDKVQRYWYPACNEHGQSSIPSLFFTGDSSYVHGGDASLLKGELAGIEVARKLKVIDAGEAAYRSRSARNALRKLKIARAYLLHSFAPSAQIFDVPDDTMICRCECVTAKDIRQAVQAGFLDVNEVKRVTRCGMGQCQGRMCGQALAELVAQAQALGPDAVGMLHIRQPFRPVTLEQYCKLHVPR